jgi:hypothetical protein
MVLSLSRQNLQKGTGRIYEDLHRYNQSANDLDSLNLRHLLRIKNQLATIFGKPLRPEFVYHPDIG